MDDRPMPPPDDREAAAGHRDLPEVPSDSPFYQSGGRLITVPLGGGETGAGAGEDTSAPPASAPMGEPAAMGEPPGLRLMAELVPGPSWSRNLRKVLPAGEWDRLRRRVYAAQGNRCAVCEAVTRLHCHEVWAYDDAAHVQRLTGFVALCVLCHHVKHLGMAGVLAERGQLDYEAVVAHFLRVNGCDRATFEAHRRAAFAEWRARSRHRWHVDLGPYAGQVTPSAVGGGEREGVVDDQSMTGGSHG